MKIFLIVLIYFLGFRTLLSQNAPLQPGVYKSYKDFCLKKADIPASPEIRNNIIIQGFFLKPFVFVKTDKNTKVKVPLDSIFAVETSQSEVFRIYQKRAYKILDTTSFWVYERESLKVEIKKKNPRNVKVEEKRIKNFYFSKNATGEILPLTKENIALSMFCEPGDSLFLKNFSNYEMLIIK